MLRDSAIEAKATYGVRDIARDLLILLGFSVAVAVTRGYIKTHMGIPGHSAIFWIPVLVLAGSCRRPGVAVGSAICGGLAASGLGRMNAMEFSGLLASAAAIEAFGIGLAPKHRALRMLLAGILGHFGKLGVKALAVGVAGLPLNRAGLTLFPTFALYAAFGLAGGAIALGLFAAWQRLRGEKEDQ